MPSSANQSSSQAIGVGSAATGATMGLIGAGLSAYGISQMDVETYEPKKIFSRNLKAWQRFGPRMAELEQQLRPEFAEAGLAGSQRQLFGGGESMGMIDQIGRATNRVSDFLLDQNRNVRPQMLADFRAGDPLLAETMRQAQEGLERGGQLDPAVRREVQQATRSGQSARGLGYGQGNVFEEILQMGSLAEARKRANQQFALQALSNPADLGSYMASRTNTDPFATAAGLVGQYSQMGAGAGPSMFNPLQMGGMMPVNNASSNALSAGGAGLMSVGGSLIGFGGAMAGGGGGGGSMGGMGGGGGGSFAGMGGGYGFDTPSNIGMVAGMV